MSGKKITRQAGASKSIALNRVSTDGLCPVWRFDRIDHGGEFAFDLRRPDIKPAEVVSLFEKVIQYSNMKWADIKRQTHDDRRSKHHFLEYDSLSTGAQQRIAKMGLLEETDQIFSFAFDNTMRVIGIRQDEYFYAVWIDPVHGFCPSHKKHT